MISKMQQHHYFVITGGPGVGKTTLLNELGARQFHIVPEDARRIIQEQVAAGGKGLPWENKELYAALMLEQSRHRIKRWQPELLLQKPFSSTVASWMRFAI